MEYGHPDAEKTVPGRRPGDLTTERLIRVCLQVTLAVLGYQPDFHALGDAVDRCPPRLVVDMADVSFIDSTGLGALISAFQRARDNGTAFVLANPSTQVRQVLVWSGLMEVVPVTP